MADEPRIPTHRWFQLQRHIALAKEEVTKAEILAAGIARIDAASSPLAIYAVLGNQPELILDFANDTYSIDGEATTDFDTALNYTGDSLSTMVDSDGVLKWAPHNLQTHSEDFTNTTWTKSRATIDDNSGAGYPDPFGGTAAMRLVEDTSASSTHRVFDFGPKDANTWSVFAKADGRDWIILSLRIGANDKGGYFNLSTGEKGGTFFDSPPIHTIEDFGGGWYLCTIGDTSEVSTSTPYIGLADSDGGQSYTGDGTSGVYLYGAHYYRSDLGGMVDNPDRGDSYVPTTSAAVYMPRRNSHLWDGAQWVNEGLLLESEARTNLVTYSNDFTDASWIKAAGGLGSTPVVTSDFATSPDGTQNATRLQANSGGATSSDFSLIQAGTFGYGH